MRIGRNLLFVLALAVGSAHADTIVLKSGRRITATTVFEEGDRIAYETPAGRLSLPKSAVARIERGGPGPAMSSSSGELAVAPPRVDLAEGYDDVVRATVAGGSIDRNYLARLEAEAQGSSREALARVAVAHHAAAQFLARKGELEDAIGHYRRALTFAPEHLGLLLNVAYLQLRRSEYTAALDQLERARRLAPDSADVAKLMGWAYYGSNKIDQAVEEWRRTLRLRPDAETQQALEKALRDQQEESSYREGESRHFNLRYHGGAAPALAREILRALEEHFRAIESALNFTPPESIGVILYTEQAFADITRAPGWVGALNDGRIRVPVQGLTSITPELNRTLRHELAHSFIHQKTHGRAPVWLHEGIAQWMEGLRSGENAALLVGVHERNAAVPMAMMEGSWMTMPGGVARYAYAWALAVVEYVIQTYGMGDIERLLDRIGSESSVEAAVRSTLRMDYSELEDETLKYLRRAYLR